MQITPLLATQSKAQGTESKATVAGDYDKFLTLLTVQLRNQDPLAPMDATQFTNQLVQFSQVEQTVQMNQSMRGLLDLQQQSHVNNAVAYVGKTVEVLGQEFSVSGGQPVAVVYAVDGTPAAASVQIYDGRGQLVQTLPAPTGAGPHRIEWDAKNSSGATVTDGIYRLQITANDQQGKALKVQTGFSGQVTQVQNSDGKIMLSLGRTTVPLTEVISVRTALERSR